MKLWVSHPTGNTFVRALLAELGNSGAAFRFFTTIAARDSRRAFDLPSSALESRPLLELARLALERAARGHFRGALSRFTNFVFADLDRSVAARLQTTAEPPDAVYCYEDSALETFRAASDRGVARVYDLPIAYWKTVQQILRSEAERLPAWESTLIGTHDHPAKLERKTREIELAQCVVCPSQFVLESLPDNIRGTRRCLVAEFGSPAVPPAARKRSGTLRVLFAGSMTQRKGLADLFAAMKLLNSREVELIVAGSLLAPLSFYRREFAGFTYEQPRPHAAMLELMHSCDILVLPSLVEGRALVQQEALACGLPLIVTRNTGGEDLIDEGRTGFLVSIRSPEAIASRIDWFASNRSALESMRQECRDKAARYSWRAYSRAALAALEPSSALV